MPNFGHRMLEHWGLDPDVLYLNHGTVGAVPLRVLATQRAIRDQIERQPSRFLLRELSAIAVGVPLDVPRMRAAAAEIAAFVGARGEDLAFVDNATTGCNAVLRSLPLGPGDEILVTDHGYGGIDRAVRHAARERGAVVRAVTLPYPPRDRAALAGAIEDALGPRTRLAVVDHVTSSSALVLPIERIVARCRARGVPVLVDGAHAPGMLPLDLPAIGADWYTGNLHKWAWSPRSAGFLWAPPERQAGLHPAVISWGLDQGFTAEFDWVGTRDPSPFLAAPVGLRLMAEWGVDAVRAHNHGLAWHAARHLAARWDVPLELDEPMVGAMATVPLPARFGSSAEDAARLRDALLAEDRIEIQLHAWRERLWVRVSAQVYNAFEDIERLAEAVLRRG
jgi:isopenicillin-N epimerase